jgi:hypothetical protein
MQPNIREFRRYRRRIHSKSLAERERFIADANYPAKLSQSRETGLAEEEPGKKHGAHERQ